MDTRRNFQGVLNILSFNRHFYFFGFTATLMLITSHIIFDSNSTIFWTLIIAFVYGLVMPLIVSAYVYDFSGYYGLEWLDNFNLTDSKPNQILNINAGFDEMSYLIKERFPQSHLTVFDFYNPEKHTEKAITRARNVSLVYPDTKQISTTKIPLKDNSVDIIFLLSAAHEIRNKEEKLSFLKECHRLCKKDGKVIMVEHLRDFPNFIAFTVGFTHFFSKKLWRNSFLSAGFSSFEETKFTPYISIFKCCP